MNNTIIKEKLVLKKTIRNKLYKLLFTIIIFLIGMISTKINPSLKVSINKTLFEESIDFMKNKNIYYKYFDNKKENKGSNLEQVSLEKISYTKEEKTATGVKLTVNKQYPVPCIEDGIIIYVGIKDNLNTIILEQVDGIRTTYANVNLNNYKLYDFIEKGEIIGESLSNELYLSQEKEGVYLDYKKYI